MLNMERRFWESPPEMVINALAVSFASTTCENTHVAAAPVILRARVNLSRATALPPQFLGAYAGTRIALWPKRVSFQAKH